MSRASLQTPPLSSRAMHKFLSHSLCFPGCTDHNSELSTRSLEADVTSGLTVFSWDTQQIDTVVQLCTIKTLLLVDATHFCHETKKRQKQTSKQLQWQQLHVFLCFGFGLITTV